MRNIDQVIFHNVSKSFGNIFWGLGNKNNSKISLAIKGASFAISAEISYALLAEMDQVRQRSLN